MDKKLPAHSPNSTNFYFASASISFLFLMQILLVVHIFYVKPGDMTQVVNVLHQMTNCLREPEFDLYVEQIYVRLYLLPGRTSNY